MEREGEAETTLLRKPCPATTPPGSKRRGDGLPGRYILAQWNLFHDCQRCKSLLRPAGGGNRHRSHPSPLTRLLRPWPQETKRTRPSSCIPPSIHFIERKAPWPPPTHPLISASAHQRISASAHQRISASAHQRISASAHQRISASAHQRISASAHQRISASAHQRISASAHQRISASAHQRNPLLVERIAPWPPPSRPTSPSSEPARPPWSPLLSSIRSTCLSFGGRFIT